MKYLRIVLVLIIAVSQNLFSQINDAELYPITEESKPRDGVNYGEIIKAEFSDSKIFPGTKRRIDVFVPADYDGKTPVCICIKQDNLGYNIQQVFTHLIKSKEIPMMIAVGIAFGSVEGAFDPESPRNNRTFEYDTPSGKYADFILKEVLPFIETLKTKDGRAIVLSKDGNDRMIMGASSGAAAAFSAAWYYPQEFPRVYSVIGSFTGLRGSYEYSSLLHKVETKPLRLFLQSGENDMWTSFGDWWAANNAMVRALDFAGYDYAFEFGKGTHNGAHGIQLLPKAMRFLWKDYPAKISPLRESRNTFLRTYLIKDEPFKMFSDTSKIEGLTSASKDKVFAYDSENTYLLETQNSTLKKICEGKILASGINEVCLIAKSNGELFTAKSGASGYEVIKKVEQKIFAKSAIALKNGEFFVSASDSLNAEVDKLWKLDANANLKLLDSNLKGAFAISISANENWLNLFEMGARRGYSYKIEKDYTLNFKQEFFHLHTPQEYDLPLPSASVCDKNGLTYVAAAYGILVCDYNGRTCAILPMPNNERAISLVFGGEKNSTLFVLTESGKIYSRVLKTSGASVFKPLPKIRVSAG